MTASTGTPTAPDDEAPTPAPAPAAAPAPARWDARAWPWWLQALAVYAGARLVSAVALVVVAQHQVESYFGPAKPSYLQFTGGFWDALWYQQVAEGGYPSVLPRDAAGVVQQNPWAF